MENIINIKSQTKLSSFSVVYHGSTLNEKPGWYGMSHLIEHLVCKNFEHLFDEFDKNGIYWNAYTSDTNIVFYITGLDQHVNKFKFQFLDAILNNFNITQEQLDNEKKIVLEEYTDTFSNQEYSHILNLLRKKFNRYTAIGLYKDIENYTLKDIYEYYNTYIKYPSKIVNVVYDEKDFIYNIDMIEKFGETLKQEKVAMGVYDVDFELNNEFKDKESIVVLSPIYTENFIENKMISLMLSYSLKSPLMDELREKRGLAYMVDMAIDNFNDEQYYMYICVQTRKGNSDEVISVIKDVLSNPEKYLTKDRFEVVKNLLLITFEKNEIERYKNISKYIKQPQFIIDDKLENLQYDDVIKVYDKYFKPENWHYSVDINEFNK